MCFCNMHSLAASPPADGLHRRLALPAYTVIDAGRAHQARRTDPAECLNLSGSIDSVRPEDV